MLYNNLSEEYKKQFEITDNEVLKREYLRIIDEIENGSDEENLSGKAEYIKSQIALNVIYM